MICALGGAAAGFTGAVLNGANFVQTVKATLTGAFWGAMSAGLNFMSADTQLAAKLFKHAFSNMWLEGIRGGNMKHGLLSGLASAAGGSLMEKYGSGMSRAAKVAANAVIGGTVEELGGGKFANGALTGAFSMLFNDLMHTDDPKKKEKNNTPNTAIRNTQKLINSKIIDVETHQTTVITEGDMNITHVYDLKGGLIEIQSPFATADIEGGMTFGTSSDLQIGKNLNKYILNLSLPIPKTTYGITIKVDQDFFNQVIVPVSTFFLLKKIPSSYPTPKLSF